MASQQHIDDENRGFWDELCGTSLAVSLGITDRDADSLRRFDEAYTGFYPYLPQYVDDEPLAGARVLEIGLGFGTLGTLIASRDAEYHGVDIAENPVLLMRERLRMSGNGDPERVVQGSALALPYDDETFDYVYSIGCLHHTGDIPLAVRQVHRVLRPGGKAIVMLYNKHSFRQMTLAVSTAIRSRRNGRSRAEERVRGRYDSNSDGAAAPHTDFVSRQDVRRIFGAFSQVDIDIRNFDTLTLNIRKRSRPIANALGHDAVDIPRRYLLGTVDRVVGLDLYIRAAR